MVHGAFFPQRLSVGKCLGAELAHVIALVLVDHVDVVGQLAQVTEDTVAALVLTDVVLDTATPR